MLCHYMCKFYVLIFEISSTCRDGVQQGRQFTCNQRLGRVHVTVVALEKNNYYIFGMCVCGLNYPACKAHAQCYIVICGLSD